MKNFYIGLMSGTSRDSLDACLVNFDKGFQLIDTATIEFSKDYKRSEDQDFIGKEITKKSIEIVNFLRKKWPEKNIKAVAFPGQTISHTDEYSIQAGNPEEINMETSLPIYADFRNFDIARGGRGAPLVPEFHKYFFAKEGVSQLIFNIGGISNGTHLVGNTISEASDVGPGNCLLDLMAKNLNIGDFDKNGDTAAKGKSNIRLLNFLLEKLEHLAYPRADDISFYYEIFESSKNFQKTISSNDILCTLVELSALKIKDFHVYCNSPDIVYIHGGGIYNAFLMRRIKNLLGVSVETTEELIDSKFVEAAAFAYLAYKERAHLFK